MTIHAYLSLYMTMLLCMTMYDFVGLCKSQKMQLKKEKMFKNPKTSKIEKNNEKGKKLNP